MWKIRAAILACGSILFADVGMAQVLVVQPSIGCTPGKHLSTASTNAKSIKGSTGTLCKLVVINTTATIYYLKFYDVATAPACNSVEPVAVYAVPAATGGAGIAIPLGPFGEFYAYGIGLCLTGGIADNDNSSAAAGVTISYSTK